MDLKSMAINMAMEKLGGGDASSIGSALSSLMGNSNDSEGFDLGGLAEQFSGGGLGNALQSWLGDGDNDNVSGEQITNALGADKIAGFAQQLGLDQNDAANKLSDLLPDLMDKSSSGGSLLGNAADLASRFLK